jgi:hypothetical protein
MLRDALHEYGDRLTDKILQSLGVRLPISQTRRAVQGFLESSRVSLSRYAANRLKAILKADHLA